jgi:hypothetical protein
VTIIGRIYKKNALLVLVTAGCAIMALLFTVYGYERTWHLWNIHTYSPPFADSRNITSGAESHALGYDPLIHNPRDPWGRPMNYPRIWQLLSYLGIGQQDTIYFGIAFAALFFSGVFLATGSTGQRTALAMACCIFSPAVLLGLERGNNDLLIFFLLAVSIRVIKKSPVATAILIGCAFLLKLYPILAISVFLRENRRLFQNLFLVGLFLAFAYLALMHDEIRLIRIATPQTPFGSYGLDVAWEQLQCKHVFPGAVLSVQIASYVIAILVAAFSILHAGRQTYPQDAQDNHLDAFRVGASIYVGTFVAIGHNFDYKMMFLLFAVPQLSLWIRSPQRWISCVAAVTATCVVVSFWSIAVGPILTYIPLGLYVHGVLDSGAKGVVFAGLCYLFVYSCPEWIKSPSFCTNAAPKLAGA